MIRQQNDANGRYHQLMFQQAKLAVPEERLRRLEQEVIGYRQREANLHRRIEGALENVGSQLSLQFQLQKLSNSFDLYKLQKNAQVVSLLQQVKFQREEIRNLYIKQGMKKWDATHQALIATADDKKRELFYRQSCDKSNFSTPFSSHKSTPSMTADQGADLFLDAVGMNSTHPDDALKRLQPDVDADLSQPNEYARS